MRNLLSTLLLTLSVTITTEGAYADNHQSSDLGMQLNSQKADILSVSSHIIKENGQKVIDFLNGPISLRDGTPGDAIYTSSPSDFMEMDNLFLTPETMAKGIKDLLESTDFNLLFTEIYNARKANPQGHYEGLDLAAIDALNTKALMMAAPTSMKEYKHLARYLNVLLAYEEETKDKSFAAITNFATEILKKSKEVKIEH